MKTLTYAGGMKKKVLIFIASLFTLILAGLVGGQAWLKGRFERDAIVEKLEAQWNCRIGLDATRVSLFSSPASVELQGLKFAMRDGEVGKPLAQRTPLDDKNVLIAANHVVLAVALEDLVRGRLNVSKLQISDLVANAEVDEEGVSTLQVLFKAPSKAAAKAGDAMLGEQTVTVGAGSVKATDISVRETTDKAQSVPETPGKNTPFKADDMRLSLTVQEAGVKNATVEIVSRKNGIKITLEKVQFSLTGIDVIPTDLANHNRCGFSFEGGIRVEQKGQKAPICDFQLLGNGSLRPFEVSTGEWSPDLNLEVTVKKDGLIGGTLLAAQLDKKDLKKLNDYGLELGDIALGGVLQEDAITQVHHVRGKTFMKQDTRLVFPQYEITLLEKSWFNAQQDAHLVRAKLVVNQELSARLLEGAKKSLGAKYGENLAALGFGVLGTTLMDDQKRITLPFKSKGSLSKPDVDMDTLLNDVKDLLKDAGKSLLQGLLGN
ncbi:hypothetical protein BH11VER1_BH11VER1_30190 [soil metagenome]